MKKLLILSTTLTSLAVIQAAQAADINVSGNTEFHLNAPSDTNNEDIGVSTGISSILTVSASFVSDSGLTYSASQSLKTTGGTVSDGLSLTVGTDFGSLQVSDGPGYGDDMETNADVAADEATTAVSLLDETKGLQFNGDSAVTAHIDGGTISYLSPTIRGIQASFGYGNGGETDEQTGLSYGVSYTGGNMDATWRLAYAGSTKSEVTDGETVVTDEVTATSAGVSGTFRNLTAAFALNTKTVGEAEDYTSNNFGATYQVRDNLGVALHLAQATDGNDENYAYNETAMSASYTFAPGLSSAVTYTIWDQADTVDGALAENDGTYARVELKVAF